MARPVKELNKEQFENLCRMNCTMEEMAGFFKVDRDTVSAWCKRTYNEGFSAVYSKFSQEGKISLRRLLLKHAERNPMTAIFLAKNLLGMSDRFESKVTTNDENKKLAQDLLESIKDGKTKDK